MTDIKIFRIYCTPCGEEDFEYWQSQQVSGILFKESALVFETNDASCDYILLVTASLEKRIKRVLLRDPALSERQVRKEFKVSILLNRLSIRLIISLAMRDPWRN